MDNTIAFSVTDVNGNKTTHRVAILEADRVIKNLQVAVRKVRGNAKAARHMAVPAVVTITDGIIGLPQAILLLATVDVDRILVTKTWNGMVRSGVYNTGCCVGAKHCVHAPRLRFDVTDVIEHVNRFARVQDAIHMVGPKNVETARLLSQILKDHQAQK